MQLKSETGRPRGAPVAKKKRGPRISITRTTAIQRPGAHLRPGKKTPKRNAGRIENKKIKGTGSIWHQGRGNARKKSKKKEKHQKDRILSDQIKTSLHSSSSLRRGGIGEKGCSETNTRTPAKQGLKNQSGAKAAGLIGGPRSQGWVVTKSVRQASQKKMRSGGRSSLVLDMPRETNGLGGGAQLSQKTRRASNY